MIVLFCIVNAKMHGFSGGFFAICRRLKNGKYGGVVVQNFSFKNS